MSEIKELLRGLDDRDFEHEVREEQRRRASMAAAVKSKTFRINGISVGPDGFVMPAGIEIEAGEDGVLRLIFARSTPFSMAGCDYSYPPCKLDEWLVAREGKS